MWVESMAAQPEGLKVGGLRVLQPQRRLSGDMMKDRGCLQHMECSQGGVVRFFLIFQE